MDDQVAVEIIAKIDKLQTGLDAANQQFSKMASNTKEHFDKAEGSARQFTERLSFLLRGGEFLVFEQVAKQALEVVEGAFKETAGAAEEFALGNAKFAAQMGLAVDKAASLSMALKAIGSSADEYAMMALKLDMHVKSNESSLTQLGVATRDANGHLVGQVQLMDNAIATMQKYKAGTDQNEFALQVFGRGAKQVYDLMRLNSEEQKYYGEMLQAFGVEVTDKATGKSIAYEEALARNHAMWEALQIIIGQRVMPVMTDFLNWMSSNGLPIMIGLRDSILMVVSGIDLLVTAFQEVWAALKLVGQEAFIMLKPLMDLVSGHWENLGADFSGIWGHMKDTFNVSIGSMEELAAASAKRIAGYYGHVELPESKGTPYKSGTMDLPKVQSKAELDEARKLQDELISGEEKVAAERIAIKQRSNQALHQLGMQSSAETLVNAVTYENELYALQISSMRKRMELDAGKPLELQKEKNQLLLIEQQHLGKLEQLNQGYEQEQQSERQSDAQQRQQDLDFELAQEIEHQRQMLKQHLITTQEELNNERLATNSIFQEKLRQLDAEIALLTAGTRAYDAAMKERERISRQFHQAQARIEQQQANEDRQRWATLGQNIMGSFNSTLRGMMSGTMTWQQGLFSILGGVADAFFQMGEKILEDWITTEVARLFESKATSSASAISEITAAAGVAAANAYASTAAIPFIGPELAPGAAAIALANTMAFTSFAAAEQGMVVDKDRMVFAHKDEMILPAQLSGGISDLIKNNKTGGGKKQELHVHMHANAIDARSFMAYMNQPEVIRPLAKKIQEHIG
jgi:hypothetical protein